MKKFKMLKGFFKPIFLFVAIFFAMGVNSYAADIVDIDEARSELSIMVLKDDLPYPNAPFTLSKFVEGESFLNTVKNFRTDEMGFYTLSEFEPDTKYEIRGKEFRTVAYTNDFFVFETDGEGKVHRIHSTNEMFLGNPAIFTAYENTGGLATREVMIRVVDSEGNAVEGVPFTANNITLLSSYQTKNSDSNGIVKFELEARGNYTGNLAQDMINAKSYSITLSKNGQFMWEFRPEEITIHVFENEVIVRENKELKFEVVKNDRTHLITDLQNLIREAKEYISANEFTNEAAVERLETVIRISEEELAKETIPGYAEAFIMGLNEAKSNLENYKIIPPSAPPVNITNRGGLSPVRPDSVSKKDILLKADSFIDIVSKTTQANDMPATLKIEKNLYKPKEDNKLTSNISEFKPLFNNGEIMLPVRLITQFLGIEVKFNNQTKTATFSFESEIKKTNSASITLGVKSVVINGTQIKLGNDIMNKNGTILLSVSDIENIIKGLGLKVDLKWDDKTKNIFLESSK